MNRKFMPKADTSTWTPLPEVADKIYEWTLEKNAVNGSLIHLKTVENRTEFISV